MLENYDKEYLKRVALRAVATVFGILVIIYIGYQIWHKVTSTIKYEPATPYTYSVKSSGEGYIFRSEKVIASPGTGSIVPSVESGAKVSTGSEVAGLYSNGGAEATQRLAEIDSQIALLSLSQKADRLTNRDVSKLDAETFEIITEMRRCAEQGKFSEAVSHRLNLITKVNRRSAASGTGGDVTAQIASLKASRDSLRSQLGTLLNTVTTQSSGWYYPETDGYESTFTPDKIENLTYDSFRDLVSTPAADTSHDAGKTVTSPTWYFVCELSRESLDSKEIGGEYTIYFPHNRSAKISMILEKVCRNGDVGLAVFRTDKIPDGFDFARMQSYELLENEYTGFRIPKSAVRMLDGQMGVYVLTGEVVHFRKIEVMTEYESSYIVVMNHEAQAEEETAETVENNKDLPVAQSPEWSSSETGGAAESESAPPDTSPAQYKWLGLNENVIISGKGLSDGRIITNNN